MPGWVIHSPSELLFDVGVRNCTLQLRSMEEEEEEGRAQRSMRCPLISIYEAGVSSFPSCRPTSS